MLFVELLKLAEDGALCLAVANPRDLVWFNTAYFDHPIQYAASSFAISHDVEAKIGSDSKEPGFHLEVFVEESLFSHGLDEDFLCYVHSFLVVFDDVYGVSKDLISVFADNEIDASGPIGFGDDLYLIVFGDL